ncbi:MAG: DUF3303 family protein [Thermoleophilia bacterium]
MLFHVSWEGIDPTEEGQKRGMALFERWQPPEGAEFQGFYGFADGSGGFAIVEVDSVAALSRTMAPWTAFLRFDARPILPIEEQTAIEVEGIAFRDSVG